MIQILEHTHMSAKVLLIIACTIFFGAISTSSIEAASEDDVFTDIILINGIAELADFTSEGEVLVRHAVVPDYFSSGKSHKRSLREMLNKMKVYGEVEKHDPQIRDFYHAPQECRQSLLAIQLSEEIRNATIADDVAISSIDGSLDHNQKTTPAISLLQHVVISDILQQVQSNYEIGSADMRERKWYEKKQRSYTNDRFGLVRGQRSPYHRTSKAVIEV